MPWQYFLAGIERSPKNQARLLMNRFAHLSRKRTLIFGFVLVPTALLTATLAQNNQPPRSPDPPVLIWDIDLKLANALPRNFRTTNDPLEQNKGETPSTTGLSDLRASGSGEFTPEGQSLCSSERVDL